MTLSDSVIKSNGRSFRHTQVQSFEFVARDAVILHAFPVPLASVPDPQPRRWQ